MASILMSLPEIAVNIPKLKRLVGQVDEAIRKAPVELAPLSPMRKELAEKFLQAEKGAPVEYADEMIAAVEEGCDLGCTISRYGCFSGETVVPTEFGDQPISEVKMGDKVWSFNEKTRMKELQNVSSIKKQTVDLCIKLKISSGETILTTPEHRFYVHRNWVPIKDVSIGDTLLNKLGHHEILYEKTEIDTIFEVYNLTIESNSNYYVGESGVLVHNECLANEIEKRQTLKVYIDGLGDDLKGSFIRQLEGASDELLNLLNDSEEILKSWGVAQKLPPNLRLNPDILDEITKLSAKNIDGTPLDMAKLFNNGFDDVVKNLSPEELISRLRKMNEWEPMWVDDLAKKLGNPSKYPDLKELMKDGDAFAAYHEIAKDPYNARSLVGNFDASSDIQKKLGDSFFFQELMSRGKQLEQVAFNQLTSSNSKLRSLLKDKFGIDLDEFEIFQQVQLKTGKKIDKLDEAGNLIAQVDEYFIADFLLVKKKEVAGVEILDFTDVKVIETKLNEVTDLTKPQKSARTKVVSDNPNFDVRTIEQKGTINEDFVVSNNEVATVTEYIKAWSYGSGNDIANISSLK